MNCALYASLLSDRLDSRLERDEERALEAHLALCRDCAERAQDLVELRGLLLDSSVPEPSADLTEEIFARVEADRIGPVGQLRRLAAPLLPRRPLVPSTAAAAALLVLALGEIARPVPAPVPAPVPPLEAPIDASDVTRAAREASLLTVWDTNAELIVASFDPTGLAGSDAVTRATLRSLGEGSTTAPEVRIYLFEKIVVRG